MDSVSFRVIGSDVSKRRLSRPPNTYVKEAKAGSVVCETAVGHLAVGHLNSRHFSLLLSLPSLRSELQLQESQEVTGSDLLGFMRSSLWHIQQSLNSYKRIPGRKTTENSRHRRS
jgi:hypothetical protein